RPNWFAHGGVKPVTEYAFGRQNWFACHAHEHRACRENVAIFDQTGFSKYLVKGPDALPVLQRFYGWDGDVAVGRTVYTGMFNRRGMFESDLTVIRLGQSEFYLVGGTAQSVRDLDWIRRNLQPDERVELVDITEAFSVLSVMGPQ